MRDVLRGLLLAAGYATATYYLRIGSSAHWYLPAGLRFASLFLIPLRYWPYLYFGECAALFAVRWPDAERWGIPFLMVSTLSYMPPVAGIVHLIRKHTSLPRIATGRDVLTMLSAAMAIAIISTSVNAATTYALMVERPSAPAPYVVGIWLMGQYLGIMMFASAALLWFNRPETKSFVTRLWPESMAVLGLLVAVLVALHTSGADGAGALTQASRMLFGVTAVTLTYRHGWRGAAVGAVTLALAVGLTGRPDYDPSLLIAQQVVALVISALLASGAVVTHSRDIATIEATARRRAEDAWRRAWRDSEEQNSESLARAQSAYDRIMRESDEIIADLRKASRAEHVMRLTGDLMASTRAATKSVMREIYPAIVFSADGLFGALRATNMPPEAHSRTALSGNPEYLSREGALSVYRVATAAIDAFASMSPLAISLRVRIGRFSAGTGAYVRVEVDAQGTRTSEHTAAIARLSRRVLAHGGIMRNSHRQIVVLLPDAQVEVHREDRDEHQASPVQTA